MNPISERKRHLNKISSKNNSKSNIKEKEENLNKSNEPLFDLFLSEYNELFENMLSSNVDYIFSKLIKNISQLLGKEKFESYPKELIEKYKDKLYEENIKQDLTLINSIKNGVIGPFLPLLDINTIFAHCEKCYECIHLCGQKLYFIKDKKIVICLKCNKIYKSNMIHLWCNSCNEEYYSYIVSENNNNPKQRGDYIPITWAKYHCENYIYEEIKCPNCSSGLFFNNKKKLLKCFECNYEKKAKEQKWKCEICNEEFQSELKEYYKYETKPLLNCIKYAIIKKIAVKPYKCDCCNLDPLKTSFYHKNKEGCNGKFYLSYLNKRPVIVCSKCKAVKEVPDMIWDCPNCGINFNCNGIIYIQKKKKKNLDKNILRNNINRTGSHNSIYKKENNIGTKYIIRNNKDYFKILNSDFGQSNIKGLKSVRSTISTISKSRHNNSFLEIRNITPQKSLLGEFAPSENSYLMKDNPKMINEIQKNYFSYPKKKKLNSKNNTKEIIRNHTMRYLNKIPSGVKKSLNYDNSRQIKTKLGLELKSPDFYDYDSGNSNSVNTNEMKLVKKRLVFMEPTPEINPEEYKIIHKIGSGSFGKIYSVIWEKNKRKYAMKIMKLKKEKDFENYKNKLNILINFIQKTNCKNVVKVYGTLYEHQLKPNPIFRCYVLMELAKTDWEIEIKYRSKHKMFYTEKELLNIIKQLINCYSLLQKCNITHRDVKPQNILIINTYYKICDFGEAMITHGKNGIIHQPIRGSELYMSPILFEALNNHQRDVIHNTYKSDVFSLGMCIFFAATLTFQSLYDIREVTNMEIIENIIANYLHLHNYSKIIVDILVSMLQIEEKKRPDFIQLERIFNF